MKKLFLLIVSLLILFPKTPSMAIDNICPECGKEMTQQHLLQLIYFFDHEHPEKSASYSKIIREFPKMLSTMLLTPAGSSSNQGADKGAILQELLFCAYGGKISFDEFFDIVFKFRSNPESFIDPSCRRFKKIVTRAETVITNFGFHAGAMNKVTVPLSENLKAFPVCARSMMKHAFITSPQFVEFLTAKTYQAIASLQNSETNNIYKAIVHIEEIIFEGKKENKKGAISALGLRILSGYAKTLITQISYQYSEAR